MRSLRSNISSQQLAGINPMLWQLAQTIWLGAHISYLFIFLPALHQVGLAPLLLSEITNKLWPGLLVLGAMAQLVQISVGWRSLALRDTRLLLLLAALLSSVVMIGAQLTGAWLVLRVAHGILLACGLLLLVLRGLE